MTSSLSFSFFFSLKLFSKYKLVKLVFMDTVTPYIQDIVTPNAPIDLPSSQTSQLPLIPPLASSVQPNPSVSTHSMTTRSKHGNFKPKIPLSLTVVTEMCYETLVIE
ncbi:hypothetical protein U1Q18_004727 [Sarracenia purpurea var. burkii]